MEKSDFKLQSKKKQYLKEGFSSSSSFKYSLIESDESIIITDSESVNSSLKSSDISLLSFEELKHKLKITNIYSSEEINLNEEKIQNKNNKKKGKNKIKEEKTILEEKKEEDRNNKQKNENFDEMKKKENNYNKDLADLFLRKFLSQMKKKMMILDEDDFCCEIEYFLNKYSILIKKDFKVNDIIFLLQKKLNMGNN